MTQRYEIQVVPSAYAGSGPPADAWETRGHATTELGAMRHYRKWYRWYHPQQNAWSGHVRILCNGKPAHVVYDFGGGDFDLDYPTEG